MELPEKFLVIIDQLEIKKAVKVDDILSVLWDYDQWLREEVKYKNNEQAQLYRDKLHDLMNDNNINLDEIYF